MLRPQKDAPPDAGPDLPAGPADHATLVWHWSYAGDGFSARGLLTTTALADADGFYRITGITGERNGEAIIALEPAGMAIPGNEPFAVDNLIRADGTQLTGNGFGYELEDGTFANPFFADFLTPATYLEFFSTPPFVPGISAGDTELPAHFAAVVLHQDHRGGHGHAPHREDADHGHGAAMQSSGGFVASDWFV
ncbi:hypothetical protein E2C06_28625 [Dankookia rubra]|uniref:Uncharacterized protein n=1 Tax=Dankookia rubra TaxID=1442381 RepID=A0A4R5Q959_9PROT|nr:hypothetical protein [Dankookia rubra]TDH59193.1 hypothetical protein E2C06_28625 [Dankookia rubra]